MHIFNNGKYKSIHAATAGELAQIESAVKKDKDFDRTIISPRQQVCSMIPMD
ncbi:sucrose-6-phosphate hydrolase [[Actinobacillus] rossii]|uniref:Sucrose-6-phosphate hydrolase n=1 Tax=[Actinobacillus] rossii TaxID=123820 RepID=A0A380U4M7_9PAST|nr:sucrose-6-phosphate hydrolase [[Actinobacillus] rossii]